MNKDEKCRTCHMRGRNEKYMQNFLEYLKRKDNLGGLDISRGTILRLILKK
jgi:hypothetical protein